MSELGETTLKDRIGGVRKRYAPVRQTVKKAVSEGLQEPKAKPSDVRLLRRGAFLAAEQREEEIRKLQEESLTDHLTGLYNRRFFDRTLGIAVKDAERKNHPLSLLIVDSDDLTGINNSYGHSAGDALLACTARILQGTIRSADIVARVGGDEMAIILPETSANVASSVAERIRTTIKTTLLEMVKKNIPGMVEHNELLTVSIGGTTYSEGLTAKELFNHADTALFHSKKPDEGMGKNRVTFYLKGMEMPTGRTEITQPDSE